MTFDLLDVAEPIGISTIRLSDVYLHCIYIDKMTISWKREALPFKIAKIKAPGSTWFPPPCNILANCMIPYLTFSSHSNVIFEAKLKNIVKMGEELLPPPPKPIIKA